MIKKDKRDTKKVEERKKKAKQEMLQALEKTLGVATSAAQKAGIIPNTHYRWMNEDEEYKAGVAKIQDIAKDFVESQLFRGIQEGNPSLIIFYLKTKCKDRGYIESSNINLGGQEDNPLLVKEVNFNVKRFTIKGD
ncbi:MAG: hypothetical protein WCP97_00590 [bacterium]